MGHLIRVCAGATAEDDVDVDVAAAAVDAGRDFSVEVGVARWFSGATVAWDCLILAV